LGNRQHFNQLHLFFFKKYLSGIHVTNFEGPNLPYYVNIFSTRGKLTRAYFYELEEEVRVTFESAQPFLDLEELLTEAIPALQEAKVSIEVPFQDVMRREMRQYFPMTQRDSGLVSQATERMRDFGWRDSGMHEYHRKARLALIKKSLESRHST
jgi:hypothetical protein